MSNIILSRKSTFERKSDSSPEKMKPRTSISSSAAVASSKYGSNNTCGGSSINNIFTQIGSTPGPVKEGLVSQIASRFQQVGVANFTESEADKLISKRKTSEPIKSVHK